MFDRAGAVSLNHELEVFYALHDALKERGIEIATYDIHTPEESDFIIYLEMPKQLPKKEHIHKSYLIIGEVAAVRPGNWDMKKHEYFHKIFTFCDDILDGKKYVKLNSCRPFSTDIPQDISHKEKLCTLIAGNKISNHPLELYSERLAAVRWFEQNHPDEFDFYGMGWHKKVFSGLLRPFNRVHTIGKLCRPRFKSYRGPVDDKQEMLKKYKFAIGFENAREINGYVTGDKIFDPMQAGTVPIYWGAPNIEKYVPKNCFINWEDYGNWPDMYQYIKNMPDSEYLDYLGHITEYIQKTAVSGDFSEKVYVETLLREVDQAK